MPIPSAFRPALLVLMLAASLRADEGSASGASAAWTVTLQGGSVVQARLLKETESTLFLDLGYEVLRVPRNLVQSVDVEKDAPTGAGANGFAASESSLYFQRTSTEEKPVQSWVKELGEAVVEIRTRGGLGSGFIINEQGFVLTNHHVIANDREISVTVFRDNGTDLERVQYRNVRIVALNPHHDLALLKIEDEIRRPLVWLPLGNSNHMQTGEPVFAVGSPLGLDRTVSRGIVSLADRFMDGNLYLQTTAQINPGNSGGPLFNLRGEVIGINTLKFMQTGVVGVGFAVPSNIVQLFLEKRSAYAFDPRNPNSGYHYLNPPRKEGPQETNDED